MSSPAHIIVLHIAVTSVHSFMINIELNIDIAGSKWMTLNHILIDHKLSDSITQKRSSYGLDSPGER